jgi:transposase-like protein
MVSAALREVFNASDGDEARQRVTAVLERLGQAPKVCELLEAAEEAPAGVLRVPGRRSDVVGIFPDDASASGWSRAATCPRSRCARSSGHPASTKATISTRITRR